MAAFRSARQRLGKKGAATKSAPGEIVLFRPRKKQFSRGELFARPISREDAEPVRRRCIREIESAAMNEVVRELMLKRANSYRAFYANERGDVLGVCKAGGQIVVDILRPRALPEGYGSASIEVEEGRIKIAHVERFGVTNMGDARGLFRIALDEALKLRKKGQSITLTTAETGKLLGYYETYGFKFVGHKGVLSAEDIERGSA